MKVKFEISSSKEGLIGDIRDWWNTRDKNEIDSDQIKEIQSCMSKMDQDEMDELLSSKIAVKKEEVGFNSVSYSSLKEAIDNHKKYLGLFNSNVVPLVNKVSSASERETNKLIEECDKLDKFLRKKIDDIGFSRLDYYRVSTGTYSSLGYNRSNIKEFITFFKTFTTYIDVNSSLVQYYRKAQELENKLATVSQGHDENGSFQLLTPKNKACDKAMDLIEILNGGIQQREVATFVLDKILPRFHSTITRIA